SCLPDQIQEDRGVRYFVRNAAENGPTRMAVTGEPMRKARHRQWSSLLTLPFCAVLVSCSAPTDIATGLAPAETQAISGQSSFEANAGKAAADSTPATTREAASSLEATVNRALSWHPSIDE